jgi:hypothetical protein
MIALMCLNSLIFKLPLSIGSKDTQTKDSNDTSHTLAPLLVLLMVPCPLSWNQHLKTYDNLENVIHNPSKWFDELSLEFKYLVEVIWPHNPFKIHKDLLLPSLCYPIVPRVLSHSLTCPLPYYLFCLIC